VSIREGYLHDYLAASFIGLAYGFIISQIASGAIGNWGVYIALLFVAGIFGFIPGGFVAGYVNFRFHGVGEKLEMEGLSAGFFTAVVATIVELFVTLAAVIAESAKPAIIRVPAENFLIAWIISVLFAFLFFSLGGYISGFLERRPFAMPTIFNLSRISRAPPPPPTAAVQMCPTCGQPLAFIQQYNRWYCANCKKYQ